MNWNGVQVFGNSWHPYCMDIMHSHSKTFQADYMLSVMDLQVFEPDGLRGTKWVAWMPLDHQNLPAAILNNAKHADHIITMSKHAQSELKRAGLEADYIPCTVDLNIYNEIPNSREAMGLPQDKFIVGMVAMNKSQALDA